MSMYMSEADVRRFDSFVAAAGYNIASLSKKLGVSYATLWNKRKGKTDFTRTEMEKIAGILGANPSQIFFS